jgi:hypothetical protein
MRTTTWVGAAAAAVVVATTLMRATQAADAPASPPPPASPVAGPPPDPGCIECHQRLHPGVVQQWRDSTHAKAATPVACETCHGSEHKTENDAAKAKRPTPKVCAECHAKQVEQFSAGKHALGEASIEAIPMLALQPESVRKAACASCHSVGRKNPDGSVGKCDACHTRHLFSKEEARKPEACETCHMGEDHSQYEMWRSAKHGVIHHLQGEKGRAPVCQTCHMQEGDHAVITGWGFLGLRLPVPDDTWTKDTMTIVRALGPWGRDDAGMAARVKAIQDLQLARLDARSFNLAREKMLQTCAKCHSYSFGQAHLDNADQIVRETTHLLDRSACRTLRRRAPAAHGGRPEAPRPPPLLRVAHGDRAGALPDVPVPPPEGVPGRDAREPGLHALVRLGADEVVGAADPRARRAHARRTRREGEGRDARRAEVARAAGRPCRFVPAGPVPVGGTSSRAGRPPWVPPFGAGPRLAEPTAVARRRNGLRAGERALRPGSVTGPPCWFRHSVPVPDWRNRRPFGGSPVLVPPFGAGPRLAEPTAVARSGAADCERRGQRAASRAATAARASSTVSAHVTSAQPSVHARWKDRSLPWLTR